MMISKDLRDSKRIMSSFRSLIQVLVNSLYLATNSWFKLVLITCAISGPSNIALAQELSRGHAILLEKGLQIQALVFPVLFDLNEEGNTYLVVGIDPARWKESNFTTADFSYNSYAPQSLYFYNAGLTAPGLPWGRWVGADNLQPAELPYLPSMVSFQYQDEQNLANPAELQAAKTWLEMARQLYPGVISYTNQYGSQLSTSVMQNYLAVAKPDMVMFDTYPFNGNASGANRSPTNYYRDMQKYRNLGLGGHDGTGSQSIPYGMYTQSFTASWNIHAVSDSEMRLNQFSAWAFGYKLVKAYTYNPAFSTDPSVLFNGISDASPTARFYEMAEINRQSRNLGPALIRLQSTDIRFIPGQFRTGSGGTGTNPVPSGISAWTDSADPYISSIVATNIGTQNNGRRGDVLVGYFKPLLESFDGPTYQNEIYFMIVNGLLDPSLGADVRQSIHLTFNFGASGITSLQRLSRETGLVELVPLVSDGGAIYHLDLILAGGAGDLFKFNTGAPFIIPEPNSVIQFILGCTILLVRKSWLNRWRHLNPRRSIGLLVLLIIGVWEIHHAEANELPVVSDRAPVPSPHFPDTLHAVIWRNWGLVSAERMASVLETTADKVTNIAAAMGLPRNIKVPTEMKDRGYITIIRRNWHLLPYEQLVQLLGMTSQELAFILREDDGVYWKMGDLKPRCELVKYAEPSPVARHRAAEIKHIIEQNFGHSLDQLQEPRFSFVTVLSKLPEVKPATTTPSSRTDDDGEKLRFIYSYFALYGDPLNNPELDPFPNGLLARLQSCGVNGVWLHVVLRQLVPGGSDFPEFGEGHERRLANLQKLVDRAKQFGIDVYLYINEPRAMPTSFFAKRPEMAGVYGGGYTALCTSDSRVRRWMGDSLTHIFRKVPGLGGVFTITASESMTNCASHGRPDVCPRCKLRSDEEILAEVNGVIEEGVHRAAPNAKVIVWDWGWKGHGDAPGIIAKIPQSSWFMSVSEWAQPFERGGVRDEVGEYAMSVVGPGPRATRHWQLAKRRGLKTVAKVQFNNTWELSSVPYLPVIDLVAEHCSRLAKANVDGVMLSWSLGGYPSLNLELAQQFAQRPTPNVEEALQALAERHFGQRAAPRVRQAWSKFSRAFSEFPYSGPILYRGPQHMGPANLLYAEPTGYVPSPVSLPYDGLKTWCGPYSPSALIEQFEKVTSGWADGLVDLEAAQPLVPEDLRADAAADLRVAKAIHLHFASSANQARFVQLRDKLPAADAATKQQLREQLVSVLDSEIELAKKLYNLATADSRLGYEASNHYFYVPLDLSEKVINCVQLRQQYGATK